MSPVLVSTIISRLPLLIFPKETTPSTSLTTAGLDGFLASKSSVTLGSPPVISPDLADFLGISLAHTAIRIGGTRRRFLSHQARS